MTTKTGINLELEKKLLHRPHVSNTEALLAAISLTARTTLEKDFPELLPLNYFTSKEEEEQNGK